MDNDDNINITTTIYDINNLKIVANHKVNATTNGENADTEPVNIDNINTAEIEIDSNDDVAKGNNNDDNLIMSDKESPLESPAKDNAENDEEGENSTEEVPSPLIYGRKTNDPTKVKSSKRCRPVKVTPLESPMGNSQKNKDKDKKVTDTLNTYVFYPNDLQIHAFFLETVLMKTNPTPYHQEEFIPKVNIHITIFLVMLTSNIMILIMVMHSHSQTNIQRFYNKNYKTLIGVYMTP